MNKLRAMMQPFAALGGMAICAAPFLALLVPALLMLAFVGVVIYAAITADYSILSR